MAEETSKDKGTSAKPEFLDEDVAVERIRELTTSSRMTWLLQLGFLAFIGLTLLSVRDVDFYSLAATIDLPIVGIAIPTTTFFWAAAWLAAILHTYFHVHLLKLWDALAEAPASIGEGNKKLKLGDRIFPWLVNDWALRRRPDQPINHRSLDWLATIVTALVIWLATPLVLAGFWWRSMPAHSGWMTFAITSAFALACLASLLGWRRVKWRLHRPGLFGRAAEPFDPFPTGWRRNCLIAFGLLVIASLLRSGAMLIGPLNGQVLVLAPIDLASAEIAQRPDDWRARAVARRRFHVTWCDEAGIPAQACEIPMHEDQQRTRERWCEERQIGNKNCSDRFAELDYLFELEWSAERTAYLINIGRPDMQGRDLRRANASRAFLANIDLSGARLQRADLTLAELEGASLVGTQLDGANLSVAQLEGADLSWARLERANLSVAQLKEADLFRAQLKGADLRNAQLVGTNLREAQLEGANLREAQLIRADLRKAQLEGADLRGAAFHSAALAGAIIGPSPALAADFSEARNLAQDQLALVIGDERTILPRDAGGNRLHVWSCWREKDAETFIRIQVESWGQSADYLREELTELDWICPHGQNPKPVGTPAEPDN